MHARLALNHTQLRIAMLAFAPRLARRAASSSCFGVPQAQLAHACAAPRYASRTFSSSAPARSNPLPETGGKDKAAVGVSALRTAGCLKLMSYVVGFHT